MVARSGIVAACFTLSLLAALLTAEAQPLYRIAVLFEGTAAADMAGPEPRSVILRAFVQGLRDLGYVEGRNIVIERRSAEGKPERLPNLAAELVRLDPHVLLVSGERTTPVVLAATATIPIVQPTLTDPVERGYAKSLAQPGKNLTGLSLHADRQIYGKLLEFLKEAAPRISRVAVLQRSSPVGSTSSTLLATMTPAADRLGITLLPAIVDREDQFVTAFETVRQGRADGLIAEMNGLNSRFGMRIAEFAAKNRMPAASGLISFAQNGGLLGYGPNVADQFRRAASYVDRILKGARAADLPIEQPAKFELVINKRTARTIGATIPPSLLLRTHEVIE